MIVVSMNSDSFMMLSEGVFSIEKKRREGVSFVEVGVDDEKFCYNVVYTPFNTKTKQVIKTFGNFDIATQYLNELKNSIKSQAEVNK